MPAAYLLWSTYPFSPCQLLSAGYSLPGCISHTPPVAVDGVYASCLHLPYPALPSPRGIRFSLAPAIPRMLLRAGYMLLACTCHTPPVAADGVYASCLHLQYPVCYRGRGILIYWITIYCYLTGTYYPDNHCTGNHDPNNHHPGNQHLGNRRMGFVTPDIFREPESYGEPGSPRDRHRSTQTPKEAFR